MIYGHRASRSPERSEGERHDGTQCGHDLSPRAVGENGGRFSEAGASRRRSEGRAAFGVAAAEY